MGFRCCVPNCRGNYDNGPHVPVFSFPKDEDLRRKWMRAIHRKTSIHLNLPRSVKIIFNHRIFKGLWSATMIPVILPYCPDYLSAPSTSRKSAEERRIRNDNKNLQKVGFSKEQLQLISVNKQCNRYSPEFSVFCSILYIAVPHPQSIHNIRAGYNTNPLVEQNDTHLLNHMKQKFNLLEESDHIVSLMTDQIHVKLYLITLRVHSK